LLVAAVTSILKVTVTLSELRIRALDIASANLLGSNLFNIIILAVSLIFRPQRHTVIRLVWVILGLFLIYILNNLDYFQHGN